jgi:N-formylglutamate deformylase
MKSETMLSAPVGSVTVQRGTSPLILGQPHGGTFVPDSVKSKLNANGLKLADTDWHITKLYAGLVPAATTVAATFHRYVIDANRDPSGHSLYPGQNTTALCPTTDFDGSAIYEAGQEPTAAEIQSRLTQFHAPYHSALSAEVARVRALHGFAIVFDCHSIRSHIPFLFEGTLPALNIGTDGGKTCAASIQNSLAEACQNAGLGHVVNGRFRGGWTTRHYGKPETGIHAFQLEISQSAYLTQEALPWLYDEGKATSLRRTLKTALENLSCLKGLAP